MHYTTPHTSNTAKKIMQHQKIGIAHLKTTTILNKVLKLTPTFVFNEELWNKIYHQEVRTQKVQN